jgi:hypothetical protein
MIMRQSSIIIEAHLFIEVFIQSPAEKIINARRASLISNIPFDEGIRHKDKDAKVFYTVIGGLNRSGAETSVKIHEQWKCIEELMHMDCNKSSTIIRCGL